MKLTRRTFASSSIAAMVLGGWARMALARDDSGYLSEVTGYGALQPDPAGYFDLPEDFSYSICAGPNSGDDRSLAAI